jgi:hypothetical protein
MITKKILPLVIGFHALTIMSGSNPGTDRLTFKTKESRADSYRMPNGHALQHHFITSPTTVNKRFVTGINHKSNAHFSILTWDFKVKFQLNRNMSIAFSYQ